MQQGIIAPPEYLNGIRIWDDELLDEYDVERSQGSPPTPHSSGGRGRPKKAHSITALRPRRNGRATSWRQ